MNRWEEMMILAKIFNKTLDTEVLAKRVDCRDD